jgi:hypothetical protein
MVKVTLESVTELKPGAEGTFYLYRCTGRLCKKSNTIVPYVRRTTVNPVGNYVFVATENRPSIRTDRHVRLPLAIMSTSERRHHNIGVLQEASKHGRGDYTIVINDTVHLTSRRVIIHDGCEPNLHFYDFVLVKYRSPAAKLGEICTWHECHTKILVYCRGGCQNDAHVRGLDNIVNLIIKPIGPAKSGNGLSVDVPYQRICTLDAKSSVLGIQVRGLIFTRSSSRFRSMRAFHDVVTNRGPISAHENALAAYGCS